MSGYLKMVQAVVAAAALLAFVPHGWAMGGDTPGSSPGGSGGSGSPASSAPPPKCPTGMVWDPEAKRLFGKGKCVAEAELNKDGKQSLIYDYGKSLAKAGQFEDAIAVLKLAPDQHDPRVLNYLGYSHRKLNRMDEALGYYRAAVAENPDFTLVREYLGEAYIQLGLLEKAREQLSEIERICGGRECGAYTELARQMVDSQIGQ